MSLDVYLRYEGVDEDEDSEVFSWNITHNLNRMASEAGIYEALWRPEEIGITRAKDLIVPLAKGLDLLLAEPDRMKAHNPPNGWGNYDGLCRFVAKYLAACTIDPEAFVSVSR